MSLKTKTHFLNFITVLHWHMHTYTKAEGDVSEHTTQGKATTTQGANTQLRLCASNWTK